MVERVVPCIQGRTQTVADIGDVLNFWNAIQKYGWDNFSQEILFEHLTDTEAISMEEMCIRKYDTVNNGYNVLYNSNVSFSEECRKNISNSLKNSPNRETRIAKIVASSKGDKNHFFGKHHTEESKAKMRAAKLGKKLFEEHRRKISENNKRPFLGKHHTEEAKSRMSAAKLGKSLSEEHREKVRLAGLGRVVSQETRTKIRDTHRRKGAYNAKEVLCKETGVVYKSISEASREVGVSRDLIRFSCRDPNKAVDGFHWEFYSC